MAQQTATTTTSFPIQVIQPLTTTYTPSPSCLTDLWGIGPPTAFFNQLGPLSASECLPPGYTDQSTAIYSPGICPSGYTIACQESLSAGTFAGIIATCCPSNYVCQTGDAFGYYSHRVCTSEIRTQLAVSVTFNNPSVHTVWTTFTPGEGINAYGIILALATSASSSHTTTSSTTTSSTTASSQTSAPTPLISSPASTTAPSNQNKQTNGLSTGAKSGVAIGVILGVSLLALALWLVYRYGKRKGSFANSRGKFQHPSKAHDELYAKDQRDPPKPPGELYTDYQPTELGSLPIHELEHR